MLGNLSYTFQFQFLEQNHRASDPLCDRYTAPPLSACEQTPLRSPRRPRPSGIEPKKHGFGDHAPTIGTGVNAFSAQSWHRCSGARIPLGR